MSPLVLATALLLAAAAALRPPHSPALRPAHGPALSAASRPNQQRLNMPSPCTSIEIGDEPSPSDVQIKFTFNVDAATSVWGTEINITDYCSLMHGDLRHYKLYPLRYGIVHETVAACGSPWNRPILEVFEPGTYSPVEAYCDKPDIYNNGCGPLQVTVIQHCRPLLQ